MSWTCRRRRSRPGDVVCSFSAETARELVIEGTVFGSQAGDLFSVRVELLAEGLDSCRLVPWSQLGLGRNRSLVALHLGT
jgi:hypothetical protein